MATEQPAEIFENRKTALTIWTTVRAVRPFNEHFVQFPSFSHQEAQIEEVTYLLNCTQLRDGKTEIYFDLICSFHYVITLS